ncbi:inactive pancreatic lipase-related protein 1-like [Macrobrachium nipponense]|uniref:inactive pancreatic lipase-related protein 1-like n=1 Tax=Macrobrachium nipponense TaxID=159736 RepID=UPI0030C7C1F0
MENCWPLSTLLLKILLVGQSIGFIYIPIQYCYDGLGCVVTDEDFYDTIRRPLNPPPFTRQQIALKYTVYTIEDPAGKTFSSYEMVDILDTPINVARKTKILVHGFLDSEGQAWYPDMVKALLNYDDFNVITVNWKGGSRTSYTQAAVNTRVVGMEIAHMVSWLVHNATLVPADVHIIGHSLGAHAAGYAGERIKGLGRITGLDPAEPMFQDLPIRVRLDPSDAKFVDVIHTDSDSIFLLGLGLEQPSGHLDFYPNGGRSQPGCLHPIRASISVLAQGIDFATGLTPEQKVYATCSHSRSTQLFTDSMVTKNCTYDAYYCISYEKFLDEECNYCGKDGTLCATMGINADMWPGVRIPNRERVKMYLVTGGGPKNFCLL